MPLTITSAMSAYLAHDPTLDLYSYAGLEKTRRPSWIRNGAVRLRNPLYNNTGCNPKLAGRDLQGNTREIRQITAGSRYESTRALRHREKPACNIPTITLAFEGVGGGRRTEPTSS